MIIRFFANDVDHLSLLNIASIMNNISLSVIQKETIVGNLLGDASLERAKPTYNTRFRFDQSYPEHSSYLQSLYLLYQNLTGPLGSPKIYTRNPDKRTGKVYTSIAFKTRALDSLNYFHDLFYVYDFHGKSRKVIPESIQELLTARGLAYWIMDDGGINAYKATILNTNSFTYNEVLLLQKALEMNFGLRTWISIKRPNQWIILIGVRQTVSLSNIVGVYMHPSMYHKVAGLSTLLMCLLLSKQSFPIKVGGYWNLFLSTY